MPCNKNDQRTWDYNRQLKTEVAEFFAPAIYITNLLVSLEFKKDSPRNINSWPTSKIIIQIRMESKSLFYWDLRGLWSFKVQVLRSSSKTWVEKCDAKLSIDKTQCLILIFGHPFLTTSLFHNISAPVGQSWLGKYISWNEPPKEKLSEEAVSSFPSLRHYNIKAGKHLGMY